MADTNTIDDVVTRAADASEHVVVEVIDELGDAVSVAVRAAELVARAGDRSIAAFVRDLARTMGGVTVKVRRVVGKG